MRGTNTGFRFGGEATLVADGQSELNRGSIYATQWLGGEAWEIPVEVEGAAMNRRTER